MYTRPSWQSGRCTCSWGLSLLTHSPKQRLPGTITAAMKDPLQASWRGAAVPPWERWCLKCFLFLALAHNMLQTGQRKRVSWVFPDQDAWSAPAECAGSRFLARLKQKGNSERKHTHTNSWCLFEYCGPGILVCESVMTDSALKVVWKSQIIF